MSSRGIAGRSGMLLFSLSVLYAGTLLAQTTDHYAIENARIVTVSGQTIERGTVVVQGGLIQAVGADVETPPSAWVIDGMGLTVYPGLVGSLTTVAMSSEDAPAAPAGFGGRGGGPPGGPPGGRGADQSPPSQGPEDRPGTFTWVSAADRLEPDEDQLGAWRGAGFTTVVTSPSNGFFSGDAAAINLAGERPRQMVLEAGVAHRLNLTGGPGHRGYPSSLAGAFAYVKQFMIDVRHYQQVSARYDSDPRGLQRPEYDLTLEAAEGVRTRRTPLLFPGSTATELRRAIATSAQMGVRPILYGAQSGYAMASELAAAGAPVLVDVDWPAVSRDPDPEADESLEILRHRLLAPTTPASLQAEGVSFGFYADSGRDIISGVRGAVEAGLDPVAAVHALTLGAARIFGVDDRVGSVEVGKIANLTVTEGGLFDEDSSVKMVFVDGQRFEAEQGGGASSGRGGRGGRGGGRAGGAGDRGADPDADRAAGDDADDALSDNELRALIGPSYRGPYRDDAVTVIRNATILTVTNGTIEGGSILIRDGRIAEVGRDVSVPSGAHVIDAEGQFVMPGIIDAHTHIAGGFNEGSVNVSAMTGVLDVINPDDINIYRALAGGVTAVNVLHGSANPIGGQNAVLKLRWGADGQGLLVEGAGAGIKFALGENPKRGGQYPSTRMGVMDIIRQAFIEAQAYKAEWDAYAASGEQGISPRLDLELEALKEILEGERLVHAHSYRGDEILQLLRLAEEFGFRIGTLQHVLEGYKVAKEIAEHGAGASTFSDWWGYKMEAYDAIPYNAAIMVENGVTVSINSDSNEEMRHLNQEAAKTIKWGGLTEDQALSLITINPARQLGIDGRTGSIEVGKDADLVIFDRHPLDNFSVPQKTYVDGKLYFDIDGDRERQAAIRAEKEALTSKRRIATEQEPESGEAS
ncbi:MAG: amidohydrolase family protein [Gemmatimonadota bacterium]|nr:amidohydrolase family protein [Gemmatimonadota bacterium]